MKKWRQAHWRELSRADFAADILPWGELFIVTVWIYTENMFLREEKICSCGKLREMCDGRDGQGISAGGTVFIKCIIAAVEHVGEGNVDPGVVPVVGTGVEDQGFHGLCDLLHQILAAASGKKGAYEGILCHVMEK